jgi:modulator of FtsH protease
MAGPASTAPPPARAAKGAPSLFCAAAPWTSAGTDALFPDVGAPRAAARSGRAMDAWGDFFAAMVGGASALLGLLFVGLSLNLERILAASGLASRALLALVLLLVATVLSLVFLMPGLGLLTHGLLVVAAATPLFIAGSYICITNAASEKRSRLVVGMNLVLFELAALPYLAGGVLLIRGDGSGIYWIAAAQVLSIVKAAAEAWVLLVEIKR